MNLRILIFIGIAIVIGFVFVIKSPESMSEALIEKIALAIAAAEGFFGKGNRPARNHNPGDLRKDLNGRGIGTDDEGFIQYATDADGWDALYRQVRLFFSGSLFYRPNMTIGEVAQIYAPGADSVNWAQTVAGRLGVTPATRLSELG